MKEIIEKLTDLIEDSRKYKPYDSEDKISNEGFIVGLITARRILGDFT